jgi:hypothetical protein
MFRLLGRGEAKPELLQYRENEDLQILQVSSSLQLSSSLQGSSSLQVSSSLQGTSSLQGSSSLRLTADSIAFPSEQDPGKVQHHILCASGGYFLLPNRE